MGPRGPARGFLEVPLLPEVVCWKQPLPGESSMFSSEPRVCGFQFAATNLTAACRTAQVLKTLGQRTLYHDRRGSTGTWRDHKI